jgi:hypothetical protein
MISHKLPDGQPNNQTYTHTHTHTRRGSLCLSLSCTRSRFLLTIHPRILSLSLSLLTTPLHYPSSSFPLVHRCCCCHFCNTYLVHTSRLCLPGSLPCLRTRLLKLALTGLDPRTTHYFTRFLLLQTQKWCASGSLLDTQETLLQEQQTYRQTTERKLR